MLLRIHAEYDLYGTIIREVFPDYGIPSTLEEGVPLIEALWLGASEKFRAVIMTSLAIVLGVVPQLWSVMPVKSAMGAVMIGGMLASIVFSFLFTPVAFWYVVRLIKGRRHTQTE